MYIINLNKDEIKKIIPHREPMLLLDEVNILTEFTSEGKYFVKGNEYFLKGHYPNNAIVPGVIQCEMMAQLGAVLIMYNLEFKRTPMLAKMDKVEFKKSIYPNSLVDLSFNITKKTEFVIYGNAKACVENKLVSSMDIVMALL